jgi:hypothetical protein
MRLRGDTLEVGYNGSESRANFVLERILLQRSKHSRIAVLSRRHDAPDSVRSQKRLKASPNLEPKIILVDSTI